MIQEILASSFSLIWELEERPVLDILRHSSTNNPQSVGNLLNIDPYQIMIEGVECIYAGAAKEGDLTDDTTRTNLTLFVEETSLTDIAVTHQLIFRYKDRLYKTVDKDPNYIFGLIEFNLTRVD